MSFKINTTLNEVVKIAAILQLLFIVLTVLASTGNLAGVNLDGLTIYLVMGVLAILMPLYITGVLAFLGEKMSVIAAFAVYTTLQVILTASAPMFRSSPQFNLLFASALGSLAFVITIYLFIMSFFVRSKLIFSPVLLLTIGLMVVLILKIAIPLVYPFIYASDFETVRGAFLMRKAVNYAGVVSALTPVSVILITARLNRFMRSPARTSQ